MEKSTVEKILSQNEDAFFEFVRQYQDNLYYFVLRQIRDKQKAEEIVQDVFIDFLEALRNYQYQSTLKTFLFSIAKYKVIDEIRKKKQKKILFSGLPDYFVESLSSVVIDDEMNQKELSKKISKTLDGLPQDYQLILSMKYFDNVRVKEIARKLAMPFKATESLLFRARKAFVKSFQET